MQCPTIKTTLCLMILSTLLHIDYSWAAQWQLEKQKGLVSIYSQQTDSGYKKILVKTTAQAHPYALIALFDDITFSPQWMHNCIEAKIIEKISPTELLVNTFFKAPWPVKNRDMVTLSKTTIDGNTVQIEISDRGEKIAPHANYVRMQNMYGLWKAQANKDGTIDISYEGGGNPGGKLPVFIANRELINSMFNTFQNLSKVISLDRYQPNNPPH